MTPKSRQKFLKIKVKINKKHFKKALWAASVVAAGFILFTMVQHATKKPSAPAPVKAPISRPRPQGSGPGLVFVIDDIGLHDKFKNQLQRLGADITYAVLPLLPYSKYFE